MITKLRKIVAYITATLLMLISVGFIKPNFSGEPTLSSSDLDNKSAISTDIHKNHNDHL